LLLLVLVNKAESTEEKELAKIVRISDFKGKKELLNITLNGFLY